MAFSASMLTSCSYLEDVLPFDNPLDDILDILPSVRPGVEVNERPLESTDTAMTLSPTTEKPNALLRHLESGNVWAGLEDVSAKLREIDISEYQ